LYRLISDLDALGDPFGDIDDPRREDTDVVDAEVLDSLEGDTFALSFGTQDILC